MRVGNVPGKSQYGNSLVSRRCQTPPLALRGRGQHRGGTTLLASLLAAHPAVHPFALRREGTATASGLTGPMSEGLFWQPVYDQLDLPQLAFAELACRRSQLIELKHRSLRARRPLHPPLPSLHGVHLVFISLIDAIGMRLG